MIHNVDPQLSQWDVGRSVSVSNTNATHIHFANQGDSKAVIIEITNGEAKIPDYLLQTGRTLLAYAVLDGVTLESKSFPVRKRERPENYVYEDDQRNYIYELIASAEESVKDANQAAEEAGQAANNAAAEATRANAAATAAEEASVNANEAANRAESFIDSMIGSVWAAPTKLTSVTLLASAWVGSDGIYSQVVAIDGITEYSKVDLLPSVEQLAIFHNKDVAFVTENEDGIVTVYAIGDKPTQNYTMQVSITEVAV